MALRTDGAALVTNTEKSTPRIAIFAATSGHSGVDRIIRNLVPELAARGVRVDVLKVAGHGPHVDVQGLESVRIVELGSRHANTSLLPLIRYLRRVRPDVMLSDKDRVNRTALWACRLAGVDTRRVVRFGTTVSVNLLGKNRLERWAQTFSIKRFYRQADAVVVPSQGVKDDLVSVFGLPDELVSVVPNPIVTGGFESLAAASVTWPWADGEDVRVVIGVGELSERKDFATLLRAFARVRSTRVCRLLLVGDGRQRSALATLAETLEVADDVHFTGFVDNPYPYIRRSDVLALTSRWEGMGVVLAEALALGVQVVSTDCPSGPREVLQDGRVGFLASVGDVDAVATSLLRALDEPFPKQVLTAAADSYRVERSVDQYMRVCGLSV